MYSRIILWVQPPVKELPTFPFLGFYSHNVTARHGIKKEAPSCAWRIRGESRKGKEEPAVTEERNIRLVPKDRFFFHPFTSRKEKRKKKKKLLVKSAKNLSSGEP